MEKSSMSTSQRPSEHLIGSQPHTPTPAHFDKAKFKTFDVEWSRQGADFIYHFWPTGNDQHFPPEFELALEDGFKTVLPSDADVRAEYHDLTEVKLLGLTRAYLAIDALWVPQPTFYVRVIGWGNRPSADAFLTDRVFGKIEAAAQRRITRCS